MPRARNPETAVVFSPGQLSYLPKRRYSDVCSSTDSEIPDGCYDHPVLILSTDSRKREVVVFILTSFGGKTLDEKPSRVRAFYLPIHPAPAHPDSGILLFLDQDFALPKKTYVNTETPRSIRWQLLQAEFGEYRAGRRYNYKLKPDSFAKLLQHTKPITPIGPGKPQTPETPTPAPVKYPLTTQDVAKAARAKKSAHHGSSSPLLTTQDILNSVRADNPAQYGSITPPTPPPPRTPKPPHHSVLPPVAAASTPQTVARSREGVAVETDRYIAQWRESQTREARRQQEPRSILPTYHSYSPPSEAGDGSRDPGSILRRLFVAFLLVGGGFLGISWWRCQPWICKR